MRRPPSAAASAALGPWARSRLTVRALGLALPLDVPADVFSTWRIDEGTELLLGHLPAGAPASLLDLGCGYGALGLPVAARFPEARALLVDRDLLAVAASSHNARQLGLANVQVAPGLGLRGLEGSFSWILCNVPARIGAPFLRHLVGAGPALLAPGGELRIVVIRDLEPALAGIAPAVRGPRHSVYAFPAAPGPPAEADDEALYARDSVDFDGMTLLRPSDASEDPRHRAGLSVLLDALPRTPPSSALVFRGGYGALPLALRRRYPAALVTAQERDLLDAAFTRLNARRLGLQIEVAGSLFLEGRAALVCGESSPGGGEQVAAFEMKRASEAILPGGQGLVLFTERQAREWRSALPKGASLLVKRDGFAVLRLPPPDRPSPAEGA